MQYFRDFNPEIRRSCIKNCHEKVDDIIVLKCVCEFCKKCLVEIVLQKTDGIRYLNKFEKKDLQEVGTYNFIKEEYYKVRSFIISQDKRNNLNMNYSALKYPGPNKY